MSLTSFLKLTEVAAMSFVVKMAGGGSFNFLFFNVNAAPQFDSICVHISTME